MLQVKMNQTVAENPFYGKSAMNILLNNAKNARDKASMWQMLDNAWKEAKDDKTLREGFFITCFSVAEISNRQHNIFGKTKVDGGGEAARPQGMWIFSWIRKFQTAQYYKFMFSKLITEFVSWFVILACQVRTFKGKKVINHVDTETYSALVEHDLDKVAEYLASIILKGSIIEKMMVAKWLVIPRFSKRQKVNRDKTKSGQRDLQQETKRLMLYKSDLLTRLSKLVNWEVIEHPNNKQFKGLIEWKKQYNQSLESVLFSTKKICDLDKEQFFNLLDTCPSGARYRIQRRLVDKEGNSKKKWFKTVASDGPDFLVVDLAIWFKDWEKFKETKQQEERVLTEKVRQGTATEEDKKELSKVKKEAKVNVGASSLFDELNNLLRGKGDNTLIHSILNKVEFKVPIRLVVDRSGSMGGFATNVAKLLTTLVMLKNPSDEDDNVLITFGTDATIYTHNIETKEQKNRYMTAGRTVWVDRLVDRTKDFQWNFDNLKYIIHSNDVSTNVDSIGRRFAEWIDSDTTLRNNRIEQLQQCPVFLIISDGEFNNDSSAARSLAQLQNTLAHYGWNGVIVVWDVVNRDYGNDSNKNRAFEGLQNVLYYIGWNLSIINQIFSNIHDLDVIDVFTALKSLHASNRYTKIKEQDI